MTCAYNEMYLEDAMRTLGETVDFALCDQGLNPTELTAILSNSFEMRQWVSNLGFNELLEVAPLDWIIGSYHPLHEASEDKFAEIVIDKWNKAQANKKGLKAARKSAGLTQKELAAQSGVKLRAIQLYEQNQLDLRRASVSSALALARSLKCSIEDLVWQPIVLEYDSQFCSPERP